MENSQKHSTTDIDYEFVDTIRIHFPALYQKDSKEHSDKDVVKNSWKGLCQRMGISINEVDVAKQWWQRLVDSYGKEKKQLHNDHGKSGSGAAEKRADKFTLHDLMKDMLRKSQASRQTTSNYVSPSVANQKNDEMSDEKNHQNESQEDCYRSSTASGRRGRKQIDFNNAVKGIDYTIQQIQKTMFEKPQEDVSDVNINRDVGNLIFCELQQMGSTKAEEKRSALLALTATLKQPELENIV